MARLRRSSLVGVLATAVAGGAGAAAVWTAAVTTVPLWALIWQLTVGLGCAVAGHVSTVVDRRATGYLLILAALSLFAGPVMVVAGQSGLARGLWVSAVLVTIPLALLRVVQPRRAAATRWVDTSIVVVGLATAVAGAAGLPLAGVLLGMASAAMVAVATGLRFEMTAGEDRRRVLWVILGFLLAVPSGPVALVAANTTGGLAVVLAGVAAISSLSLPIAAGVALLAPRIVDVRAVMQRSTVAALMVALAAATYIEAEAAFVTVTGDLPPIGIRVLIVVGVAAGFHPVMRWVRASVNEMLFGGRADPVHTLTLLGSRLAAGSSPPDWLDTLRLALAAPGVALRTGEQVIATSGDLGDAPTAHTDLRAGAAHVGELTVALATDDPRLARATEAVLSLVSVPLAQALHAAHLTEDLRVSRGQAVTALEEERRRMRRDLHDGLGPTLTGIAYSADAAANLLHSNPSQALEILHALRGEARDAIAEIRRIVYGLRPRALDELGLVGAVQQQVSRLRTADGHFLTVAVDATQDMSKLPAAVEVAAYRMAVEALTNVARHSGVAEASASFTLADGPVLRVTVQDRGHSVSAWTPGIGIASMRERVEQVGGTLRIHAGTHGATVSAEIPIHLPA
ncbi:sensor histidine kinase [Phytohabitans rumicis]|uniref:sensor histidine kinase n=1 Tax=Phytohabitans rumicis TaxID=1076125 RepID=UPI0031EE2C11